MKFNIMLFIIFFLLQSLICSILNEQSLKDAAAKTLKYARAYHQESIKLGDKSLIKELKLNYPPLTVDNIQFRFDEYGLLHVRFVNLKVTITGRFIILIILGKAASQFTAKLNNFNWEQVFVISQKDLGNGKLDIKFKSTEESAIKFNIILHNSKGNNIKDNTELGQKIKNEIKDLDYSALKIQLRKVAQLILETLQSDLK